jgi:hypothetical protein
MSPASAHIAMPRKAAEQEVERRIRAALTELQAAARAAEAADYGDQFTGSVDEAIKQVEYSLGMLS